MDITAIKKIIGPFPAKAAIKGEVLESVECEGYRREKVSYAVEPDERVTAYVLRPLGKGPFPVVVCHHQHHGDRIWGKEEPVGKAGNQDLAYALELVKQGYLTFAPDALAYGERRHEEDPIGYNYWEMATRLVQGKTLLAKHIHDLSQGIDYLNSRADVDAERIGFIGHSFGGRMGVWMAAFDKRIKATVCNCGCIAYKSSLTKDAGIQLEFVVQGILSEMDIEDVVAQVEPNNLLISATREDKWSRAAQEIYDYAKPYFEQGDLSLLVYEGGHVFTTEMRNNAYAYLQRFLQVG